MKRAGLFALGLVITLVIAIASTSTPARADHESTMIGNQFNLGGVQTDGESVIWSRRGQSYSHRDYHLVDLESGEQRHLLGGEGLVPDPDVSGDHIVWRNQDAVIVMNIESGERVEVARGDAAWGHHSPRIDGDWVVWQEVDEETRIMGWNFRTGGDPIVAGAGPSSHSRRFGHMPTLSYPTIQDSRIGWVQREKEDETRSHLFTYDLSTGHRQEVTAMPVAPFDLEDNLLVYNEGDAVIVRNIRTGVRREIAQDDYTNPVSDGRFVFWQERDDSYFHPPQVSRIRIYDYLEGEHLPHPLFFTPGGSGVQFHASEGTVVWQGVHALDTSVLESDRWWRNFPETGLHIRFGLLDYWESNGGIPVFGYPITEQYGNQQYFERQRLEEHPQHLGTPYDVQLGLLGTEDAEARRLITHHAFEPLSENTPGNENCQFFAETGHRLCHGFRDYWESNGLDLGDTGISYRESLALFGYPISEEFVDPDTGLVTQYFQRARFEYHPENEAPYDILLGRLGADLVEQGRLPSAWPYE